MQPVFISFCFPGLKNIQVYFGTRLGGVSKGSYQSLNVSLEVGDNQQDVLTNREKIKKHLNLLNWKELKQIHSTQIITQSDSKKTLEGDGIFSSKCEALGIKTADCQALFFTDLKGKYIGALHCGWRGNIYNFPGLGVKKFAQEFNLQPCEILAVRGPSLGPCCAEFVNYKREIPKELWSYLDKKTLKLNLWQITKKQLLKAGLLPEHIFSLDVCTNCNPDLFFSYRRDKTCGRMLNLIIKRSA